MPQVRRALVPLLGTRSQMVRARDQRAVALRQVRVLITVVWLPVLTLLAWRLLSSHDGSLPLRLGALFVFAVGAAVTAHLVVRRSSAPLVLARIVAVELPAEPSAADAGVAGPVAITLRCTSSEGAALLARLVLDGGVEVTPGDWTLLASNRSGLFAPWRVAPTTLARLGLPR